MTFAAESAKVGRQPLTVIELDLDSCSLTFGTAPCAAILGVNGRCYNTRASCQDTANYTRTTKTYRFCEPQEGVPASIQAIPSVKSVRMAPTKLTPGKGLGYRASVSITLRDHPHHDRGIDPYAGTRSIDPYASGTFWTKFLARNRHYNGRILRIRTGYITDPFDFAHFEDREYVVEKIDGPTATGLVTITAKDVLKLADDSRAQCPVASRGALDADITAAATSLTLTAGTGAEYGASGYVRVGDEIIQFGGRSTDTLTSLTRGSWGTTAATHSTGDAVQLCKAWSATNVRDIIDELLTTYSGISSSYINATDWNAEETDWLSAYSLTTIISDPTGVNTLLGELMEQCQLMLWWDDRAQQIRLRAIVPPKANTPTTIDDDQHVIAESMTIKDDSDLRITQLWVYYDKADYTEDGTKNYKRLYIAADLDAESADQYGDQRIEVIRSRWFDENNSAAVLQTATRAFNARVNSPKRLRFALDAKDLAVYDVGDVVDIVTSRIVDFDGLPKTVRGALIEENERVGGTRIEYEFLSGIGLGRFGFIGPNTLLDYSSESDANRSIYAFIGPNTGLMPDGGEPYKII